MAGGDASIWPVVVGGLLSGGFALGGIGVGLVATARREAAQERRDALKRRADKFEELVAAIYEFDHWLEVILQRDAFGIANGIPQTVSPFAKVQSIAAVYFPQFSEPIADLDRVATDVLTSIYDVQQKRLSDISSFSAEKVSAASVTYTKEREVLLRELQRFAHEEFQRRPSVGQKS
jgi:hypothetical protein